MNKKIVTISIIGIIGLIIVIAALISLIYPNTFETTPNYTNTYHANITATSYNKVVIFAPHPDDESIGMGGLIQKLKSEGKDVHVVVMCSGNGISSKVPLTVNYYNLTIPTNASAADRKKLIREDSFVRVMNIYGVSYDIIGLDDSGTTDENVFNEMEKKYKEGYGEFYTTTGEMEIDHTHCANALKMMMEKHP